ncbi:GTP-binding protein 1 [Skeletonema marinoi]|uniref:Elongation factor Tu, chloroplastic n=1 Tax=Skeletonema marinoi TaxID=267567 RepID=A0AAD8YLT0_9STRA|nr:GTP-binding protein 1 [Skeletonema marinoi]
MSGSNAPLYAKRSLRVINAESDDGSTEYKRQVHKLSTSRLHTLATQMSYRLDEGHGRCTYHIGVEDDGCHSVLDYSAVSESAWVLESIARSLNAVVLERKMIQNEIEMSDDGKLKLVDNINDVLVVEEPPVLSSGIDGFNCEDEKEEKSCGDDEEASKKKSVRKLSAADEAYTRCELTIQRVETHLLDPSPLSLSSLSRGSSFADGVNGAVEASTLSNLERLKLSSPASTTCRKEESKVAGETNDTQHTVNTVEETLSTRNIRVAVVGNVDAGKSTMIGTLTTSFLDDGRGSSRTSIMKHRHEIESGRTSTSSSHLLGFRHSGEPIAGRDKIRANKMKTEDEIARESYRIVTLMDLAGHEKYLKTTIHGVSSGFADYAIVLVNSRHPPTHMTQHHLNLCCSFGIPIIVVFTKIDGCPEHALATSKNELAKLLKSPEIGRRPFAIKTEQDIITSMGKLHTLAPTIDISCVTGEGLDLLRKMLFSLPKRRRHEKKVDRPFEFLVEDTFLNVPGVGSVVSGFVNAGELNVGANCNVYVGPTNDGTFLKTVAKSAHVARINTSHITAGQSACLAFSLNKELRKKLRRVWLWYKRAQPRQRSLMQRFVYSRERVQRLDVRTRRMFIY